MKMFKPLVVAMVLLVCCVQALAVTYVTSPPLTDVVKTKTSLVQEGGEMQLPIITWGGDMATIFANGSMSTVAESPFAQEGLKFKLVREDVFTKQLEAYISGKTPYLRATLGQMNLASELLSRDPRLKPIAIYQMTWSAGGDCLVVKEGINSIKDLKGKTIVANVYSPHVELLATVLQSAGLTMSDVKIRWTKDLTGTSEIPAEAFKKDPSVHACFVISTDAGDLTRGSEKATEGSFKGAKILFSTKSASRIIPDLYFVRADYFETHKEQVGKFVHALLVSQENLAQIMANSGSRKVEYNKALTTSAKILLDSENAISDAKGLYGDCEFVGYTGNIKFFADKNEARNFENVSSEMQDAFIAMGFVSGKVSVSSAGFDYEALKKGLTQTTFVEAPRFEKSEVAKIISQKGSSNGIINAEIFFLPNQKTFDPEVYKETYDQIIRTVSIYGGAVMTINGHADPTKYFDQKAANSPEVLLKKMRQDALDFTLDRAKVVQESIIAYAKSKGVTLDASQFAVVGDGIEKPKTGMIKGEPIRPKTPEEWRSNMRVEFHLIPVGDIEASEFVPQGGGK